MASIFRKAYDLLVDSAREFSDDHATKLSASLAYYTIFSIGPLLLIVISILGVVYQKPQATTEVFDQLASVIGQSAASGLQSILTNISAQSHSTLFGIIGGVVLIFGATGIFTEIQSSLNYIWSIKAKPKRGWLKYMRDRLLAFVLVLGLGVLMFVTLFINLIIDVLSGRLQHYLGDANIVLLKASNIGVLFLLVTFIFWVIFKVLPDARIHWKDALIGALFTGVLFLIGKFLISYYFSLSSKTLNAYGAAASIILFLTWVYYCAMILYFGAEFTEMYAKQYGKGIHVTDKAVHVIRKEARHWNDNVIPAEDQQ